MSEIRTYANQAEYLDAYASETELKKAQMKERHKNGRRGVSVLADKDEMIANTVHQHVIYINAMAQRFGRRYGHTFELPDYATVVANGGTGMYARVLGLTPERWEEIHERERSVRRVITGAPTYTSNLAAQMAIVDERSDFLGYLTATPVGVHRPYQEGQMPRFYDSQRYAEEDIYGRGLPQEPVVLRPATIAGKDTAPWKTGFMSEIQSVNPRKPVILIDDSLSTAKRIMLENEQRESGTVPLFQIVMTQGTLTEAKIKSGEFKAQHDLGIYLADWEELPDVISEIENQWNPQQ